MATTPTQRPVPSEMPQDTKFNAGKIDEFVTSMGWTYTDRFGNKHYTIEGLQRLALRAISELGYITVDSFQLGAELTIPNQILRDTSTGSYYRWDGAFPKNVPENSTPISSGGIAIGAWLAVDSSFFAYSLLKESVNPVSSLNDLKNSFAEVRKSSLIDSISITECLLIPSYYELTGIGFAVGMIGSSTKPKRVISKEGNATTTLSNQDRPPDTRDAILAIDPVWVDGAYPQHTVIKDISLLGDASSPNEVGFWIFQGGDFHVENMKVGNCKNGVFIADAWLSSFKNVAVSGGAIVINRGTSQRWEGAWANGNVNTRGAFSINDLTYSVLISCGSDGAVRGAYFFNVGAEVTMLSCGSEFAVNDIDAGQGSMIASLDNNKLTIIGYKGVPTTGQTTPLISIGNNSTYSIQNWNSNSTPHPNSLDISVNGDNSVIVIENSIFSGGRFLPVVQFRGEHPTSFVIVKWKGNEYIYKSPVGGGASSPELKYRTATFTPTLKVENATSDITYSLQKGSYKKNGNIITVNFEVSVSGTGTASPTGIVSVDLSTVPYAPSDNVCVPMQISNTPSFVSSGAADLLASGNQVFPISSSAVSMRVSNLQNGTRIKGCAVFGVNGTGWA